MNARGPRFGGALSLLWPRKGDRHASLFVWVSDTRAVAISGYPFEVSLLVDDRRISHPLHPDANRRQGRRAYDRWLRFGINLVNGMARLWLRALSYVHGIESVTLRSSSWSVRSSRSGVSDT
jgi:hypothetical protein